MHKIILIFVLFRWPIRLISEFCDLIVDKVEKAKTVLKENGFTVGKTTVIAVEVEDKTGGLANVLKCIHNANINVEYMYAFVNKTGENAVLIFRFEKMEEAIAALKKDGFTILSREQICELSKHENH